VARGRATSPNRFPQGNRPFQSAGSCRLDITTGVPNLIADLNAQNLPFSVHDGDLKAGSGSLCDDALYVQALGHFNSLTAPVAFTPGDNDWTDCDPRVERRILFARTADRSAEPRGVCVPASDRPGQSYGRSGALTL
jgi:hypothetical protein